MVVAQITKANRPLHLTAPLGGIVTRARRR
jgi:hypothetical protein